MTRAQTEAIESLDRELRYSITSRYTITLAREEAKHVSAAIDELVSERDALKAAIAQFKSELATLPESAAFSGDAKILLGAITERANTLFT